MEISFKTRIKDSVRDDKIYLDKENEKNTPNDISKTVNERKEVNYELKNNHRDYKFIHRVNEEIKDHLKTSWSKLIIGNEVNWVKTDLWYFLSDGQLKFWKGVTPSIGLTYHSKKLEPL